MSDVPAETGTEIAPFNESDAPKLIKGSGKNLILLNGKTFEGDKTSIHNALLVTESDKATKDFIAFDEFQYLVYFVRCPPWESVESFLPHPVVECDLLNFRAWLETRGLRVSKADADDMLLSLAQRNPKNPPKEYMDKLVWDRRCRLDNWIINCTDAQDDPDYLKLISPKWLIAAVKRIYEPGCKFDSTLILEGKQGWEKSKLFEIMATVHGVKYFLDEDIRVTDKDGIMKLQGKMIFEMAELGQLSKGMETEAMKAFQSRREDIYRVPYSRKVITRPRRFVIGGTINPMGGYLTDATGARRYWPVECGKHLDIEWLEANKEQLWAEAVYRYQQKERIWLEGEEIEIADAEQRKRFKQAIQHDDIIKHIIALENSTLEKHFSIEEIMTAMGIDRPEKRTYVLNAQIKETLTFHGYVTTRPRTIRDGEKIRGERWIHSKYKKRGAELPAPALLWDDED